MKKPCLWRNPDDTACGVLSTGTYCSDHARQVDRARRNPEYSTARWRRLRAKVKGAHIATQGYFCPGYGVPPHLDSRLSVDHIQPVILGGAMYDEANVQVLCISCNDRKGSRVGVAP